MQMPLRSLLSLPVVCLAIGTLWAATVADSTVRAFASGYVGAARMAVPGRKRSSGTGRSWPLAAGPATGLPPLPRAGDRRRD
jgi:hypothetical protein